MSSAVPGHAQHACTGPHDDGAHYCKACGYYFWRAADGPTDKPVP